MKYNQNWKNKEVINLFYLAASVEDDDKTIQQDLQHKQVSLKR